MDIDKRDDFIRKYVELYWPYHDFEDLSEPDKDRIEELLQYQFFRLNLAFKKLWDEIKSAFYDFS